MIMKRIFSTSLLAGLILAATSCIGGQDESITDAHVDMYNFVVDTSDGTAAPALTRNDYSDFVVNFTRGILTGSIKASGAGMSCSFQTGELEMKVGDRSYVMTKSSIAGSGCTVSDFTALYDHRPGVMSIDYTVDGKYKVYSVPTFAYYFNTTTMQEEEAGAWVDQCSFTNVNATLVPSCDSKTMTLKLYNFKKTPSHISVALTYSSIPYTLDRSGKIFAEVKDVMKYTNDSAYDISDLSIVVDLPTYKADVTFTMDGRRYKMNCNMFTQVTK